MRVKYTALAVMGALYASTGVAGEIAFTTAPVPTSDLDKRSVLTSQFAQVDGERVSVSFNTILRSGDDLAGNVNETEARQCKNAKRFYSEADCDDGTNSGVFGRIIDINGNTIMEEDGSERISDSNDFSSLLIGEDKQLYMVSHFETRPAAMYLTKLKQDKNSGKLTATKTRPLDFSHVNGGWVHCAGSVTPWGNHLGSEEYPPDGKEWRDGDVGSYNAAMVRYFPEATDAADDDLPALALQYMNPYDYGFNIEVDVKNFNDAEVVKHYAMGRVAIELAYVMPNEKTVYISDDGSYVGLFRFEADTAGDLSAGTLYAAKWTQTSPWTNDEERSQPLNGGMGDISWVELGHANNAEIRAMIDSGITFADIFEEDVAGCTDIKNRNASSGECLKVRSGMEKAAAFLETSRYAGIVGASVEFEKMEGITHDPDNNDLYLAMSRVRNGMSDGEGDISVPFNYCGSVYKLDLDADYVAYNMAGAVNGIPRLYKRGAVEDNPYPADGPYAANECDLEGISEPDNVTFIPGYNTLIIGEDTGKHQNDMIWSYNLGSMELTRIQTTPYGSETTSPYIYPDINGYAYMMSVIQHPFGESDSDALQEESEARGYTGYIGPLPALTN